MTARDIANDHRLGMSEAELQEIVIRYAELMGWLVYHTYRSTRSQPGFPDLYLVRDRAVLLELKSHTGVVSKAQMVWAERLKAANQEYYELRPADWLNGTIEEILR